MRILIVEDDFTSRRLLQAYLSPFGQCDIAVHGKEAVKAFKQAWLEKSPYDLICLDIMMPEMDGQDALKQIRAFEKERGIIGNDEVKVIMTTALDAPRDVFEAYYRGGCTSYLVKPIDRKALIREMKALCS
jgi:two-component system, chemotaxis family, chemotaxis protein CheY